MRRSGNKRRGQHTLSSMTHTFHLLIAILIDNVINVCVIVDLVVIVDDAFHTCVLLRPVHL
jgi:hypothetical protein